MGVGFSDMVETDQEGLTQRVRLDVSSLIALALFHCNVVPFRIVSLVLLEEDDVVWPNLLVNEVRSVRQEDRRHDGLRQVYSLVERVTYPFFAVDGIGQET